MWYISRGHISIADTQLKLRWKTVENIWWWDFGDIYKVEVLESLSDKYIVWNYLVLKQYKNSLNTIKKKNSKFNFVENIEITSSNYNIHHILKYSQIPTYINYEVLFDDPVNIWTTYLVMDDLTRQEWVVFSLNNDTYHDSAKKIFYNLSFEEKNIIIESAKKQISNIAKLSTWMDIKLHYDSLFFILQDGRISVMIWDLDNIEAYVSRMDDWVVKPSAHYRYGNLIEEIKTKNERVEKQIVKDFSDFVFWITEDMKEKLGAFFSS